MAKDVIYLEVDDEITSVIDKLQDSPQSVVALVLPKRATVFQSIVNMKLLKRTAQKSKKSVVLITSDPTVISIAGAAEMHVARSLQSKPEVPEHAQAAEDDIETIDQSDPKAKKSKSDEKVSRAAAAVAIADAAEDTAIELDNTVGHSDGGPVVSVKPNKKLKVPNFNKFRIKLFAGIAVAILLIVGWVIAYVVMPKASIKIVTDTTTTEAQLAFTVNSAATEVNQTENVLPAVLVEVTKTDTEKVPATGQKDKGEKASGKVTLSLPDCSVNEVTLPSGTKITASDVTFVTQEQATLTSVKFGNSCQNANFPDYSSKTVGVVANEAGTKYNVGGQSYSVQGNSNVKASGTAMAGGTTNVVKVVSQSDIDAAKNAMSGRQKNGALDELQAQLNGQGSKPLLETLTEVEPVITMSANVDQEAAETTVTSVNKYSLLGVKKETIENLIADKVKGQINQGQKIQDSGLDEAVITVTEKKSPSEMILTLRSLAVIGPDIDTNKIAEQSAGKKRGEILGSIQALEGVRDVELTYEPFWVIQTPKKASRITVTLEQQE